VVALRVLLSEPSGEVNGSGTLYRHRALNEAMQRPAPTKPNLDFSPMRTLLVCSRPNFGNMSARPMQKTFCEGNELQDAGVSSNTKTVGSRQAANARVSAYVAREVAHTAERRHSTAVAGS
jgi:hypothetical protein